MNYKKAREFCARLHGATTATKWGSSLVFSVGDKMFAATSHDKERERGFSFKVDRERFLELTDRPGIIPAPYLARAGWVRVTDINSLDDAEARALLQRSYELVFAKLTKIKQKEIGDDSHD
ncbi:MmcQ/YjbR family DNA-binding protein [Undibacterium sp. TJN25]|uniref:MmcQ/YjbR family DNA-binding protein n=1 Tax=Undibacterium sp. TJN25 TaxID=3413056 RepID=UPI003BF2EDAE